MPPTSTTALASPYADASRRYVSPVAPASSSGYTLSRLPPVVAPSSSVRSIEPRFHPMLVVLPVFGGALGIASFLDFWEMVPFVVRACAMGGGAVLGAWLSLPFVRWETVDEGGKRGR